MSLLRIHWCCVVTLLLMSGSPCIAQLAITEVMSAPRPNTNTAFRGAEYWEVTNFGTSDTNLHGFGFRDADPTHAIMRDPFTNLVLRAGESVIIFRHDDSVTNIQQFRAWWGDKLSANLQIRSWNTFGLSGWDGDAVLLFNANNKLVDSVQFGRARRGLAFSYSPQNGLFGIFSTLGVDGAFGAELADDVGTPGVTTGPVEVQILQQPTDQVADAGSIATLSGLAGAMPPPRYQWFLAGAPIARGTNATLTITNVQPADGGAYYFRATNGFSEAASATATLTVNTNPTPPSIVSAPADQTVYSNQTAVFTVVARGLPAVAYQWQAYGTNVPNGTSATLKVPNVAEALSGTRYSVRISNNLGVTNASAVLTVTRRPDLRFTEVLALPINEKDNRHFDWFELTNFDTNAVNLLGWRFSDEPTFAHVITITNALVLAPGESAVFAERLSGQLFSNWWGTNSLPPNFKSFTYSGIGLGAFGDTLYVWNAAALDPRDTVAILRWGGVLAGVSMECEHACDPEGFGCEDEATIDSVVGVRGAFRATDSGDIGSPGYTTNPPVQILSFTRATGDAKLLCRTTPGKSYRMRRSPSLNSGSWTPLPSQMATNNVLELTDSLTQGSAYFYLVEEIQ